MKHLAQEDTMTIQEAPELRGRRQPARHGGGPTTALLVGGLCGLAWAAGLRGFMAQIAGTASSVDWAGSFGWILLPSTLVGALLGCAEHLRTSGGRRGWRWLALAPLLFSAILFSRPLDILSIFQDGVGGGAIGVSLYGMLGGYALSGRGAALGPDHQRRRGPDRHPDLGPDGDLLRRPRPGAEHPTGRLGRRLLLVVPSRPDARLRHPTSRSHATGGCLTLIEHAGRARRLQGGQLSP
jgi:hypothetical protein